MLLKMSRYAQTFNGTKYMSLLIKDNELLKNNYKICDKVSYRIKKGFGSETKEH